MPKSGSPADKVLDVLLLFLGSSPTLTVDEISQAINAPRSTTYRYIRRLREKGFLEKSEGGVFCLGPTVLQLAQTTRRKQDIGTIALPVMEEIAYQTRETVLLTRRFGNSAVCVERVEGPQTVRISFERGQVQPLHAGASSKILLACADESEWDKYLALPLEAFTEHTTIDPEALRAQLRAIRQRGYCTSDSEVDIGARAVAVPILDSHRRIVAGLSTAGPAFRMDGAIVEHHLALLRAGATRIQEELLSIGR